MKRNRGIAFRLGAPVLTGAALIFLAVLAAGYITTRRIILKDVSENAEYLAKQTAHHIESVLAPVEKLPVNLAVALGRLDLSEPQLIELLHGALAVNPEIFGSAVAYEPYVFNAEAIYYAPYVSRDGDEIGTTYLGGEDYRYFYHDWYQVPKETGKSCWSEPYFDEGGGNILAATFSCPFYREQNGETLFTGVITADISLSWLTKIMSEMHILKSGYGFIISQSGAFITHPEERWVMNESIFSIAEARSDEDLRTLGRRMIRGESGFVAFSGDASEREGLLYFTPIGYGNWSLGIFFPKNELFTDLTNFNTRGGYLAAIGLLLLVAVVFLVSKSITRPLSALTVAAQEMAVGNLDVELPGLRNGGEVRILAEAFEFMKTSLKDHIRELIDTTAAKERIESELNIARDIQMGLLPKIFPPFPDIPGFDLHALLKPAWEVGGDLYDFYRIDEDRICLILGDVSGKGVPASLFMAVTMTLMKMTAAKGLSPGQILQEVNSQLSRDNDAGMFVTLSCGILNIRTGELWYANGGHNPPLLLQNDGAAVFLEGTNGLLLGAMDGIEYQMKRIVLNAGEGLFIYSDGVTEAMDEHETLFSDERLVRILEGMGSLSSARVVEEVLQSVLSFAGNAPQADDITMMVVRFLGNEKQPMPDADAPNLLLM